MAGRTDLEHLVISLEAQLKTFEKSMARAYPMADKAASQVERRFKRAESELANFGKGFVKGFLIGLPAAGASVMAAFARSVVSDLAEIKDNADRAGLSIQEMQKLTFVARQGGGGAGDIVDLFQKLNKNLSEAKAKGNDLAKILAANNVPLTDQSGQLRSNVELFENIVDLINNARNEQEATLVSMAAFGKSAADALPFLKQSSAEIRKQKADAATIGDDLVKAAAEFDDRLTAGWDNFTTRGKAAIAGMLQEFSNLPGLFTGESKLEKGTGRIVPKTFEDTRGDVAGQIESIKRQRTSLIDLKADAEKFGFKDDAQRLATEIDELSAEIGRLSASLRAGPGPAFERTGRGTPASATIVPPLGGGKGKAAKAETLLDLIAAVESGGGYNTTLGHGKYLAGGERELTTKTLDEIDAIQSEILRNPANKTGASPAGRYQIVQRTLRSLRKELDLSGNELFTPELQDKLATALINRRGRSPDALRDEFEGLRSRPNDQILSLYDSMSKDRIGAREDTVKVQVDKEKETQEQIAKLHKEADEARKDQQEEMLKYQTDHLERVADENQKAAEASAQAWDEAGATIAGVAQGFVQDLMNGVSAADALKNAVARLADAAISNFFSMVFQGGAGGGGLFGGLVRAAAPGAGAALGALGNAGNAGAVPLTAPSAITSVARAGNAAPMNLRVVPSPYFDVVVDSRANTLDAVRQAGTLSTARRHAPRTMNRFQQLGTT